MRRSEEETYVGMSSSEPVAVLLQILGGHHRVTLARREYRGDVLTVLQIDAKQVRHRRAQARYEARLRAGIALYPIPLGAREINALVRLGWLTDRAASDPEAVGEAVAAVDP